MFVRSLRNRHIRYANVTTLQILTHLYTTYAKIKPSNLDANHNRMKASYDVNLPIEAFFDQIEDSIEFASVGNAPSTPSKLSTPPSTPLRPQACSRTTARSGRENPTKKNVDPIQD